MDLSAFAQSRLAFASGLSCLAVYPGGRYPGSASQPWQENRHGEALLAFYDERDERLLLTAVKSSTAARVWGESEGPLALGPELTIDVADAAAVRTLARRLAYGDRSPRGRLSGLSV